MERTTRWDESQAKRDCQAYQCAPHDKAPWILCKDAQHNEEHAMQLPWLDSLAIDIHKSAKLK